MVRRHHFFTSAPWLRFRLGRSRRKGLRHWLIDAIAGEFGRRRLRDIAQSRFERTLRFVDGGGRSLQVAQCGFARLHWISVRALLQMVDTVAGMEGRRLAARFVSVLFQHVFVVHVDLIVVALLCLAHVVAAVRRAGEHLLVGRFIDAVLIVSLVHVNVGTLVCRRI